MGDAKKSVISLTATRRMTSFAAAPAAWCWVSGCMIEILLMKDLFIDFPEQCFEIPVFRFQQVERMPGLYQPVSQDLSDLHIIGIRCQLDTVLPDASVFFHPPWINADNARHTLQFIGMLRRHIRLQQQMIGAP